MRFRAASADGKPIFVGTAKPGAVERYLTGVQYTTIHANTGNGTTRTDHAGTAPRTSPAKAVDWTAQASGTGTQTLRWNAQTSGTQTLVVMNADGSPAVSGRIVSAAVTAPGLLSIATGLLGGGAVLLAGAVALIVTPILRARRRRSPHRVG